MWLRSSDAKNVISQCSSSGKQGLRLGQLSVLVTNAQKIRGGETIDVGTCPQRLQSTVAGVPALEPQKGMNSQGVANVRAQFLSSE